MATETKATCDCYGAHESPIRVDKLKDLRGRIYGYRARMVGRYGGSTGVERDGGTPKLARERLEDAIQRQCEERFTQVLLWTVQGAVFVVRYADGWMYDIVYPGMRQGSSCMGSWTTRTQCLENALRHITQGFGGLLREDNVFPSERADFEREV